MTQLKLIIIGAGGHGRDLYDIHRAAYNAGNKELEFIGFLDDNPDQKPKEGMRIGVIKDYIRILSSYGRDLRYVIGVNDPVVRSEIDEIMYSCYARPANLIHPSAYISRSAQYQDGFVMGPYSALTPGVVLGRHVHINSGASVNQNSKIGDYCTISPGARVCGDVNVGARTSLGANSTIINMKNVGSNVILGAGAVVVDDIPDNCTAVGVPAKVIKGDN